MLEIACPAKLNLCLDILKKDPNGYHRIQTVITPDYSVQDFLKIKAKKEKKNQSTVKLLPKNSPERLLTDRQNLLHRTLDRLRKLSGRTQNLEIEIVKNIPFSSGLGGSSSNAAALISGLNQLWDLNLSPSELSTIASELGKDIPFFIHGKTALCTHYGEVVQLLPDPPPKMFQILPQEKWPSHPHANQENKTALTYKDLNLKSCGHKTVKTQALIQALHTQDKKTITQSLHNDFETIIAVPKNTHLSGSGPAIFTSLSPNP